MKRETGWVARGRGSDTVFYVLCTLLYTESLRAMGYGLIRHVICHGYCTDDISAIALFIFSTGMVIRFRFESLKILGLLHFIQVI